MYKYANICMHVCNNIGICIMAEGLVSEKTINIFKIA